MENIEILWSQIYHSLMTDNTFKQYALSGNLINVNYSFPAKFNDLCLL